MSTYIRRVPKKGKATRELILKAASTAFARTGVQTSTTEIAKLAGITQPLIYFHFGNKLYLLKECLDYSGSKEFYSIAAQILILDNHPLHDYVVDCVANNHEPDFVTFHCLMDDLLSLTGGLL